MNKQRLFSGIQATGNLHLGNYLGAVQQWVKLQEEYDAMFCVVDLHAITTPQDPEDLYRRTIDTARVFLASGIDAKENIVFAQSHVQEHAELCWILNSIARMGDMEKMTQFKDKSARGDAERASVGLFDYPVLMAADILLYDTVAVPVGEDQVQHVELARTIARRFNKRYGDTFFIPKPLLATEGKRIMGLDDPSKKMSKSAVSEYNYISLTDSADLVRKKIKKAVTDSGSEIVYQDDKPALKNLLNIFSLLAEEEPEHIIKEHAGKGYAEFKENLADVIINFLEPFQDRMESISDDDIAHVLTTGSDRARKIAKVKMRDVKKKVGFVVY